MKWMVASDLHGSATVCEKLLEAFRRESADKLLLLGDLLYHGPRNPLPEGYDPKQCCELLNGYRSEILCVRGNCDAEVDQMVLEFPIMADYLLLQLGRHTVFATHGHVWHPEHPPLMGPGFILLCGHTHHAACDLFPDFLYLNPGSPALPKGSDHRGYLVLEEDRVTFKMLDGGTYWERALE
ncbi:MAG: phosphodiesterase [Oscillospiraceae bacterium]|nr:phosphodiesterase [Oscillospiraceae bacterium]